MLFRSVHVVLYLYSFFHRAMHKSEWSSVRTTDSHAGDPGSNPGFGIFLLFTFSFLDFIYVLAPYFWHFNTF